MSRIAIVLVSVCLGARGISQQKSIPVGIKVESEGDGHNRGMWIQEAIDVSPQELKTIQSRITNEIKKQGNINIVPLTYSGDYIGIAIVIAKVPHRNGSLYIASSVILAVTKTTDEFGGQNILAASDLEQLARAVGLQFASLRLQVARGLQK